MVENATEKLIALIPRGGHTQIAANLDMSYTRYYTVLRRHVPVSDILHRRAIAATLEYLTEHYAKGFYNLNQLKAYFSEARPKEGV